MPDDPRTVCAQAGLGGRPPGAWSGSAQGLRSGHPGRNTEGWWEDGSEVAGGELSGAPMGVASWGQPQVQAERVLGPGRPQEGRA